MVKKGTSNHMRTLFFHSYLFRYYKNPKFFGVIFWCHFLVSKIYFYELIYQKHPTFSLNFSTQQFFPPFSNKQTFEQNTITTHHNASKEESFSNKNKFKSKHW